MSDILDPDLAYAKYTRRRKVRKLCADDPQYIPPDLGLRAKDLCPAKLGEIHCSRKAGHDGEHAAYGTQWARVRPFKLRKPCNNDSSLASRLLPVPLQMYIDNLSARDCTDLWDWFYDNPTALGDVIMALEIQDDKLRNECDNAAPGGLQGAR